MEGVSCLVQVCFSSCLFSVLNRAGLLKDVVFLIGKRKQLSTWVDVGRRCRKCSTDDAKPELLMQVEEVGNHFLARWASVIGGHRNSSCNVASEIHSLVGYFNSSLMNIAWVDPFDVCLLHGKVSWYSNPESVPIVL